MTTLAIIAGFWIGIPVLSIWITGRSITTHTEAEARAQAIARHLPKWIVKKAEACK